MNPKYKDDIKMILRDIGKDAGGIIAFVAIVMGVIGVVNNSKDFDPIVDIFVNFPFFAFSSGFFLILFVGRSVICEIIFSAIIYVFLDLIKSTKLLTVFIMVLLVMICAYFLRLYFYVKDPIITAIFIDFIFMLVFFVPLYINRPKKSIFFTIVSFVVIGACLLAGRISRASTMINFLPVVVFALLFIVLFYKNISVNKSNLVMINLLLIQTIDFFFILSLKGEEVPIVSLVVIGIYKAVVLFFRYKKYREKHLLSYLIQ